MHNNFSITNFLIKKLPAKYLSYIIRIRFFQLQMFKFIATLVLP